MSGEFNKIPSQCAAECPLQQDYVDRNGAVLTRNCVGPSHDVDTTRGSLVVRNGEVTEIDTDKVCVGTVACRNVGLVAWKEAIEAEYLTNQ